MATLVGKAPRRARAIETTLCQIWLFNEDGALLMVIGPRCIVPVSLKWSCCPGHIVQYGDVWTPRSGSFAVCW